MHDLNEFLTLAALYAAIVTVLIFLGVRRIPSRNDVIARIRSLLVLPTLVATVVLGVADIVLLGMRLTGHYTPVP
jgi:hypothetical protein